MPISSQSSLKTPKLWNIFSVITKSIFSTRSFSVYFQPGAAANILKVINCLFFRQDVDSVNMFIVVSPLLSID